MDPIRSGSWVPWGRGSALTPCPPALGGPGQFSAGLCPPVSTPACGAGPPGDLRAPFRFVDGEPRQWSGRKMPGPPPRAPERGFPVSRRPHAPTTPWKPPGADLPWPRMWAQSSLPMGFSVLGRVTEMMRNPEHTDGLGAAGMSLPQESRVRPQAGLGTDGAGCLRGTRASRAPGGLARASSE